MIVAVLVDGDGRPVCTEMWPGNTADVGSLIPVIDRLQCRFRNARVCVVADRGMISGSPNSKRAGCSTSWACASARTGSCASSSSTIRRHSFPSL